MNAVVMVLLAFTLDLSTDDPHPRPHPVKAIERLITVLTKKFNKPEYSRKKRKHLGVAAWLITVGGIGLVVYVVVRLAMFNYYLYMIAETYLSYACLSAWQLAIEAEKIIESLKQGNLRKVHYQVGMIVGRGTENLNVEEVTRVTIKTVAENTNDGMITSLLFLVTGGPVLGLMCKAISTLDSVVGYRNGGYRDFSGFSAKAGDITNYIPARLTWLLLIINSWVLRNDTSEAVAVGKGDCGKHLSPNSAFSEAVVARALHPQLGGPHYYFGELVEEPYIGSNRLVVATNWRSKRTITMLYMASLPNLGCFKLIRLLTIWK